MPRSSSIVHNSVVNLWLLYKFAPRLTLSYFFSPVFSRDSSTKVELDYTANEFRTLDGIRHYFPFSLKWLNERTFKSKMFDQAITGASPFDWKRIRYHKGGYDGDEKVLAIMSYDE